MEMEHGLYRIGNYLYSLDAIDQMGKIRRMKEEARKALINSQDRSARVYVYKDEDAYGVYSFTEDEVEEDILEDFIQNMIYKAEHDRNRIYEVIVKRAKNGQLIRSYFSKDGKTDSVFYNYL